MKKYYCVTDFDGIENYYSSYKEAKRLYEEIVLEAEGLNIPKSDVALVSFELPRVKKEELVMLLLNHFKFMVNRKTIR